MNLRDIDKRIEASNERNVYLLRLLAKYLAEESVRLERAATQFDNL